MGTRSRRADNSLNKNMGSITFDVSEKGSDFNDAPVSHTFAEQNREQKLVSKAISTAISDSRRKTKLLRKEKHIEKLAVKSKKSVEYTEKTQASVQVPENRKNKTEERSPETDFNEEFTLSTTFNPLVFANRPHEPRAETIFDTKSDNSCVSTSKATDKESDEGYNGSDEQDLFKSGSVQLSLEQDFPVVNDSIHRATSEGVAGVKNADQRPRTRAGKRNRKRGRLGAFHVELTSRDQTACNATEESQKFLRDNLFQPIRITNCGKFDRVSPETLACLSRKRRVQKMKR